MEPLGKFDSIVPIEVKDLKDEVGRQALKRAHIEDIFLLQAIIGWEKIFIRLQNYFTHSLPLALSIFYLSMSLPPLLYLSIYISIYLSIYLYVINSSLSPSFSLSLLNLLNLNRFSLSLSIKLSHRLPISHSHPPTHSLSLSSFPR